MKRGSSFLTDILVQTIPSISVIAPYMASEQNRILLVL